MTDYLLLKILIIAVSIVVSVIVTLVIRFVDNHQKADYQMRSKCDALQVECGQLQARFDRIKVAHSRCELVIRELQTDRNRWRELAEHLCDYAGEVDIPEQIASKFVNLLGVRGD
jgi:hypothetical protein